MSLFRTVRRRAAAVVAMSGLASLGVSAVAMAPPAQAYGAVTVRYAVVDTGDCRVVAGSLRVNQVHSDGCSLYDAADGTFFRKDAGARAVKIEIHDGAGLVGKVEFHPYGEKLWVYDTRNDGDTIYVQVDNNRPVGAGGSSDPIDYEVYDYSFGEGRAVRISVFDDLRNGLPSDLLARVSGQA